MAAVWGPMLEKNVRAVLERRAHNEVDLVVDLFFDTLLTGRNRFTPAHGRGVAWMRGIVRAMARVHQARLRMNEW